MLPPGGRPGVVSHYAFHECVHSCNSSQLVPWYPKACHFRGEVSHLEREIDSLKRAVDGERKKADGLIRERDLLNKLKTQAEHATHKQIDLIKINENTKRNLEQEMNGYKVEAQKQAKVGLLLLSLSVLQNKVLQGNMTR